MNLKQAELAPISVAEKTCYFFWGTEAKTQIHAVPLIPHPPFLIFHSVFVRAILFSLPIVWNSHIMSSFPRTVAPLLRTANFALRQQTTVNPVQHVFSSKNGHAIRGLATVFERTKPHVNIGRNRTLNTKCSSS